jgi:hypothetical protein
MIDYYKGDDFVEGVYPCPRCNEKTIAEKTNSDGVEIDTRDRISDLKVNFMEDASELEFDIEFEKPIIIKTAADEEEIRNITMTLPTLENHIEAESIYGDGRLVKLQYAVYARAIIKVNGQEVDNSWKKSKGMKLFLSSEDIKSDIGKITDYINQYGVDPRVEKTCKSCGKVWQPIINTSNFFASALR